MRRLLVKLTLIAGSCCVVVLLFFGGILLTVFTFPGTLQHLTSGAIKVKDLGLSFKKPSSLVLRVDAFAFRSENNAVQVGNLGINFDLFWFLTPTPPIRTLQVQNLHGVFHLKKRFKPLSSPSFLPMPPKIDIRNASLTFAFKNNRTSIEDVYIHTNIPGRFLSTEGKISVRTKHTSHSSTFQATARLQPKRKHDTGPIILPITLHISTIPIFGTDPFVFHIASKWDRHTYLPVYLKILGGPNGQNMAITWHRDRGWFADVRQLPIVFQNRHFKAKGNISYKIVYKRFPTRAILRGDISGRGNVLYGGIHYAWTVSEGSIRMADTLLQRTGVFSWKSKINGWPMRGKINLDHLVDVGTPRIALKDGKIGIHINPGTSLTMELRAASMYSEDFYALWPPKLHPKVLAWLQKHLATQIQDSVLRMRWYMGVLKWHASFILSKSLLKNYHVELPDIYIPSAHARLDKTAFRADIQRADMLDAVLSDAKLRIGFGIRTSPLTLSTVYTLPLSDLKRLLPSTGMQLPKMFQNIDGVGIGNMHLTVDLQKKHSTALTNTATISRATILVGKKKFLLSHIVFNQDNKALRTFGTWSAAKDQGTFTYSQKPAFSHLSLRGGINLSSWSPMFAGHLSFLADTYNQSSIWTFRARNRGSIIFLPTGWTFPEGSDLKFNVYPERNQMRIDGVGKNDDRTSSFSVEGTWRGDAPETFLLSFTTPRNVFQLVYTAGVGLRFEGDRLVLSETKLPSMLSRWQKDMEGGGSLPEVTVHVARLTLLPYGLVSLDYERSKGKTQLLDVNGTWLENPLYISYKSSVFRAGIPNVAWFLHLFHLAEKFWGGDLKIKMTQTGNYEFNLENLSVKGSIPFPITPKGKKIMIQGRGEVQWAPPFLNIENASFREASGSSSITFSGKLNTKTWSFVEGDGLYIPFYKANKFLSHIPFLNIFIRENASLLGASFVVRGPLSNPKVTLNPLSVLTPGILRNVWRLLYPLNNFGVLKKSS